MDKLKRRSLGRLLRYCLALRPDEFGLVPDRAGWVPLKQLARALSEEEGWGFLREDHLREVARDGPFELSEGGLSLRSAEEDRLAGFFAEGEAAPALLYVAARRKAYPVIVERGLQGHEGQPVVLAVSREMALKVGRRRDAEPVMIEVRAEEAQEAGVSFTRAGEPLWVAEEVPRQYVSGPPLERVPLPQRHPQAPKEPVQPEFTPGSFLVRPDQLPGAPKERRPRGKGGEPEWKRERRRDRRKPGPDDS